MLAARNGLDGQTLRKQYKEKISGYRNWAQLGHAGEYILFADNFGEDMNLDETCLSNGEVYTVLTNKAARGKKGGVGGDGSRRGIRHGGRRYSGLVPVDVRGKVKTVTTDLSSAMMLTAKRVFPKCHDGKRPVPCAAAHGRSHRPHEDRLPLGGACP